MRTQCLQCMNLQLIDGEPKCTLGKPIAGLVGGYEYCTEQVYGTHESMTGKKVCSKCGKAMPTDEFYRSPRSADGLDYWCKWCLKEKNIRNQDRAVAMNRERMRRDPEYRERRRAYHREYRRKHYRKKKEIAV